MTYYILKFNMFLVFRDIIYNDSIIVVIFLDKLNPDEIIFYVYKN